MGDKGYVEAVKWYRKAAEQNYAEAQSNLGLCYEKGQGRCPKTGEASCDAHTRAFFNKGVWWMPPPGRGGGGGGTGRTLKQNSLWLSHLRERWLGLASSLLVHISDNVTIN